MKNIFFRDTAFGETFWLPLIGFDINVKYIGYDKNMKTCRNLKIATEFGNFFKIREKEGWEIGKYLTIQKY